ncbi:DUF3634 family protein [Photobacterium aphoticum]|uniref:DUF3634 domain-containing protein n=1 Tax=Photobacterium aphoticum TaxID=754436 RepID=A0A090QKB9_9GAMM|nr:DUF3634 family protein [Photobacterium aphoticum]KLV00492.1 hypothetical protein ABT58_12620 [Photobacterium aphoticum]PSU59844.1 DUF3634 domain-containing protein [Photobacterium aphoticum]GAL03575.1 hypothetical protein JCM19237_6469 [Photobacterium aphoticum]GHA41876.1 hypothetical protein GCM10007086_14300 [Photobacterium aphoticum]
MWYVILLVVAVCLLVFIIDRPAMLLKFEDGKLVQQKGNIPRGFLMGCKDIAQKQPFSGKIKVYNTRFNTKLVFSKTVPSKVKQRIHNVFPYSGGSRKRGKRA